MFRVSVLFLVMYGVFFVCYGRDEYHGKAWRSTSSILTKVDEANPWFWIKEAKVGIERRLHRPQVHHSARNVIMFLGDGMSVATLTAARALLGQRQGYTGEEAHLSFEKFPTVGLAKTYCLDGQIADSACTATAYLCGNKANVGTIGVSGYVERRNCTAAKDQYQHVHSIAAMALQDGRDAGIVTTTRVTHASPAGAYAHTADRDWESDADVAADCGPRNDGPDGDADAPQADIALQLIHSYPGNKFKVILGGGRREFLPNTTIDEEGTCGKRLDGRNLIEEWQKQKEELGVTHQYVWDRAQLMEVAQDLPEYVLGLFEGSHMQYHLEADESTEPTLAELTEVAIRALNRNRRGFFLFVEGGRIDHAHHDNYARMALDETIELSKAVARATELLDQSDTLIVVTSDHSHVMSFNGYAHRGADVLGFSDDIGDDGLPYMTLSYANGPGYRPEVDGRREDLTHHSYGERDFRFAAAVPLASETHGGDDVAVFARGPHHRMFNGLYEQSQLPHLVAYAACLGRGSNTCTDADYPFYP